MSDNWKETWVQVTPYLSFKLTTELDSKCYSACAKDKVWCLINVDSLSRTPSNMSISPLSIQQGCSLGESANVPEQTAVVMISWGPSTRPDTKMSRSKAKATTSLISRSWWSVTIHWMPFKRDMTHKYSGYLPKWLPLLVATHPSSVYTATVDRWNELQ